MPRGRLRGPGRGVLLLLTAAAGCGGDAAPGEVADAPMVESSDRELAARAAELLPELGRRAGLELKHPIRLERRTREELVDYLEAKLDEELPPREMRTLVEAYALLGLVPAGLDLRSTLLDVYTEQVAGFYEPDSTALFLLDDQPAEALEGLLVHELVHALQDQSADLGAVTDAEVVGNDRATAALSAIEGHAMLVMLEWVSSRTSGGDVDLGALEDFAASLRPALEGMRSQFPALAEAPAVIREPLLFPYLEGAGYVQGLWSREGRVAPFDDFLPQSTEQVATGELADAPIDLRVEVRDRTVRDQDVLGRLELGILLDTHAGEAAAGRAEGWGGDRWVLVEDEAGAPGLVLATAWDSAEARDDFVTDLGAALERFPRGATLDAVDAPPAPLAILRVGSARGADVGVTAAAR